MHNTINAAVGSRPRVLFWAVWGTVFLFFQLPLAIMMIQDDRSLYFSSWDTTTFLLFSIANFLLLPGLAGLVIEAIGRFNHRFAVALLLIACGFLAARSFDYGIVRPLDLAGSVRMASLGASSVSLIFAAWWLRVRILPTMEMLAYFSPILWLVYAYNVFPIHDYFAGRGELSEYIQSQRPAAETGINHDAPVILLTFEKLGQNLFAGQQGELDDARYPNIAKLLARANFYPNAFADSIGTKISLSALYSGRLADLDLSPMEQPGIFQTIGRYRKVNWIDDYLGRICDRGRFNCVRVLSAPTLGRRWQLMLDWYTAYSMTIIPYNFFYHYVGIFPAQPEFFPDGWIAEGEHREQATNRLGVMQMDALRAIVASPQFNNDLVLIHSLINHDPTRTDPVLVDREVGKLIEALEQQGKFDQALIVVSSDTGVPADLARVPAEYAAVYRTGGNIRDHGDHLIERPDGIFLIIKEPYQQSGRVIESVIQQIDILPTMLGILGDDPARYPLDGREVTH